MLAPCPPHGRKYMGKIDTPVIETKTEPKVEKSDAKIADISEDLTNKVIGRIRDEVLPEMDDAIEIIPLRKYFELDGADVSQDKYVKDILSELKRQGAHSRADQMVALRELELKLGRSHTKESRISKVHTYLRLKETLTDTLRKITSLEKRI